MNCHVGIEQQVLDERQVLDMYYLPVYGKLCVCMDGGEYVQYDFETEYGRIINPFIIRPVPEKIDGEQYYDISTPYGYGGPIILSCTNKEKLLRDYSEAFGKYCLENRIVSEFIRFHPLFKNYKDVDDTYEVVFSRHTVGTNLKDYDDPVQKEFCKSMRRDNRRALQNGVTCVLHHSPKDLSVFRLLYEETMRRNGAAKMYFFSDEYYRMLETDLSPYILEAQLHYHGEIIASEIYFTAGTLLHAHLLGDKENMRELQAGGLLEATVALWGKNNGYQYIHHGGGRTSDPQDLLYLYKKKFGKNTEFDFYIGKKIWNERIYNMLCSIKMPGVTNADYFPAYRGGMT